jgi:catechol 2,3-dioxygenase-like lactoylglutathione lyase family enzyme
MARIKLIHHVNVQISDRARTREWYERVLGAEFLDRGPALNTRQLQLRLGSGEIHFTETPRPAAVASGHFALEVDDWQAMLAHLDDLGIPHVRTSAASTARNIGGTDPHQGRREDTGEHYTYVHDPDGNMIELVYHPLGIEDSEQKKVELTHDARGLRWTQLPGFVAAAYRDAAPRGTAVTP